MENRNTQFIVVGTKFFRFKADQDEPEIIRVRSVDSVKNLVKYFDKESNKLSMPLSELKSEFKILRPDGVVFVMTVKVGETSDVLVTVAKYGDTSDLPFAVCRQCVSDVFANNMKKADQYSKMITGISVSVNTCPQNIDYKDFFTCSGVKDSMPISVYLDDSLDDILSLIKEKKYDTVLRLNKQYMITHYLPNQIDSTTLCETLRGLLESNQFMYDFRCCFGITEVPYPIDKDSDALSQENILFIEDLIQQNIMETYVIPYTKEIDLRSIKRSYMLIASAYEKYRNIYIVGYDISDNEYVNRSVGIPGKDYIHQELMSNPNCAQ